MTPKEKMNELIKHQSKLPMPKEYKETLYKYTRTIYKWLPHINSFIHYHQADGGNEIKGRVTSNSMKLLSEMKVYLENICELRAHILSLSSALIMVGFNFPTRTGLEKFNKVLEIIDEAMLDNMVILEKYKKAINNHRRLSISKCKKPITDIENLDCWPYTEIMNGFYKHGEKVMDLVEEKPK